MKRRVLGLLLFLLIVPLFMACDQKVTTQTTTATAETTVVALGTITFEIYTAGDNPETTEVETEYVSNSKVVSYYDGDTLFSLMFANFSMACQGSDGGSDDSCSYESQYGHYVLAIDTLQPDASLNQFVAFYIDGEMAMTGVDATDLVDGSVYQFRIDSW